MAAAAAWQALREVVYSSESKQQTALGASKGERSSFCPFSGSLLISPSAASQGSGLSLLMFV